MTPKQLREWLFQNTQDDQWWLSLDAVTEEAPVTVTEIEDRLKSGQYLQAQVLHVSQAELANPPWIEVELPAPPKTLPAAPQRPAAYATSVKRPEELGATATTKAKPPQETLGILLLLLPLVAALLTWFWIGSMNLLQNPGSTLSFLTIGTIIGTGILVGVEANQLGIGGDSDTDKKGRKKTGPVGWAAFTMLMWIAGYPAYLWYRSKYGAKNMVVGGIAVTLIFLAATVFMNAAIEEQKGQVRDSLEEFQRNIDDLDNMFDE